MEPASRIEIVIDALHARAAIEALQAAGAPGFTLFSDLRGAGDRGARMGDDLTDALSNVGIVVIAAESDAPRLAEAVRPLLQRHGGYCFVTRGASLKH